MIPSTAPAVRAAILDHVRATLPAADAPLLDWLLSASSPADAAGDRDALAAKLVSANDRAYELTRERDRLLAEIAAAHAAYDAAISAQNERERGRRETATAAPSPVRPGEDAAPHLPGEPATEPEPDAENPPEPEGEADPDQSPEPEPEPYVGVRPWRASYSPADALLAIQLYAEGHPAITVAARVGLTDQQARNIGIAYASHIDRLRDISEERERTRFLVSIQRQMAARLKAGGAA